MNWTPEALHDLGIPVHYSVGSAEWPYESADYDGICGVIAFPRDKFTTSNWAYVTCKRCLKSKKRKQNETSR